MNNKNGSENPWKIVEHLKITKTANDLVWNGETVWDFSNLLENSNEVKIFIDCQSGASERDIIGHVTLKTSIDIAKFCYHSYNQDAWSFNSENIILKLDESKKLIIVTSTKRPTGNFLLSIHLLAHRI